MVLILNARFGADKLVVVVTYRQNEWFVTAMWLMVLLNYQKKGRAITAERCSINASHFSTD